MNKNQRYNQVAIKKYRKELQDMLGDISQIDVKVITRAVNEGLADVKRNTPVGHYSREVNFYTKSGEHVHFTVATKQVGGFMRQHWHSPRAIKTSRSVSKELANSADYSSFVNDGHRIVRNGITIGFVKGKFMLEKAVSKINKAMLREFGKEVERVNKEHDK
jgi:uncharacterized protein (DUF885 family)